MLNIIEIFNKTPTHVSFDSKVNFQPGQIMSLKTKNNDFLLDICDGIHPYGLVDDIKTDYIRHIVINKEYYVKDLILQLDHKYIIPNSFISNIEVDLNPKTGEVNITKSKLGSIDKLIVSYAYNILDKCDTTMYNKAVVWTEKMIAVTDMFDTTCSFNQYNLLYTVNGLLTSKNNEGICKSVGMVLEIPTADNPVLKFLFDPKW